MSTVKENIVTGTFLLVCGITGGYSGSRQAGQADIITQSDISSGKVIARTMPADCQAGPVYPGCSAYSPSDIADVEYAVKYEKDPGSISVYSNEKTARLWSEVGNTVLGEVLGLAGGAIVSQVVKGVYGDVIKRRDQ